ncbi:class D sortase [Bacillus sp. FJAT-45066]|uniref:class D sortase n=1 Tax=Bacillus sp. FJAT-45066 TaxID=2011010 RepID=UPI000BB71B51|nr:class D sortase [Bacillus sp. FJAT-45066]
MKKSMAVAIIFIIAGLSFVGYGLFEKIKMDKKTEQAMEVALDIISNRASANGDDLLTKPDDWNPGFGDVVGLLQIERINAKLPIVAGTDPDDLEKGVGHYTGSSYPGEIGQIVLSGHRDTVFRRLGELQMGDEFVVAMPYGDFVYEIYDYKIVDADDLSIITLQKEKEDLLLTTCYPFSFVGNAPDRYILYAKPKKP